MRADLELHCQHMACDNCCLCQVDRVKKDDYCTTKGLASWEEVVPTYSDSAFPVNPANYPAKSFAHYAYINTVSVSPDSLVLDLHCPNLLE